MPPASAPRSLGLGDDERGYRPQSGGQSEPIGEQAEADPRVVIGRSRRKLGWAYHPPRISRSILLAMCLPAPASGVQARAPSALCRVHRPAIHAPPVATLCSGLGDLPSLRLSLLEQAFCRFPGISC